MLMIFYITKMPLWVPNSFLAMPLLYFTVFVLYKLYVKIKALRSSCIKTTSSEEVEEGERRGLAEDTPLINTHAYL